MSLSIKRLIYLDLKRSAVTAFASSSVSYGFKSQMKDEECPLAKTPHASVHSVVNWKHLQNVLQTLSHWCHISQEQNRTE